MYADNADVMYSFSRDDDDRSDMVLGFALNDRSLFPLLENTSE
jgi:hypothetical protein